MVNIKRKNWLNKNSIFTKLFVPVIIIMLVQAGIINTFLAASGTIAALENNALDVLAKNVQTRGINLEHLMVNYWSNIGQLEDAVRENIEEYLRLNDITLSELLGNQQSEERLLQNLAYTLIDALWLTSATGVFMYFLGADGFSETMHNVHQLNGLYFRSLSPLTQQGQYGSLANLMMIRGPVKIARDNNIPLDSLWDEKFTFDPEYEEIWRGFAYPQLAFAQFPRASSLDLSYWNGAHVLHPWSPRDVNRQVSYSRPVIVDGRPVAIIGTDVQLSQMERHFPARDLDNFRESGYMLVRFSSSERNDVYFKGDIFQIAGSFLNRLVGGRQTMTLSRSQREGVYFASEYLEAYLLMQPLRLYNTHSPFSDEQWALLAASTAQSLFEMPRNVNNAVLASTVLSVFAGALVLLFVIKNFTKPIGLIIDQIEQSDGTSVLTDSRTYEIDLLCHTINEMVERRKKAESQTLEERQRYLLALENSTDTFMEYDLQSDVLSVYYFTEAQQAPSVTTVPRLSHVVEEGQFMHPDDATAHAGPFASGALAGHECRIQPQFLPHLDSSRLDEGYLWVNIKMRYIMDAEGKPSKAIGTVREITKEKLAEQDAQETIRRDVTTGFYSPSYGLQMLEGIGDSTFTLLSLLRFDELEMAYGRIFGGIYMAEFAHKLSLLLDEEDLAVRLGNESFLLCLQKDRETEIKEVFASLYCGEKKDLSIGFEIRNVGQNELKELPLTPINVHLDLSDKENLDDVVLELFERSLNINSSVNILISLIGRLFELNRVIILSSGSNFSTLKVSHQWHSPELLPLSSDIKKIPADGVRSLQEMLGAEGTVLYKNRAEHIDPLLEGVLCLTAENSLSYCVEIYENALSTGRILFVSNSDSDGEKVWAESERDILQTITKIIATNLSADRSRSASRAKSLFLSRVSHEIRTPMNAIIGLTNIALTLDVNTEQEYERVRSNLRRIYASASYMLGLINDVLEMSRVESGRLIQIDEQPFSLNRLVNSVDDLMRFPIEEKGLRFEVINRVQNSHVVGDEQRLRQVIINLLGNANKFTKAGGLVTFMVEELADLGETSKNYIFTVKDTGIGIPIDKQGSIFNPFEQVESTTSPGSMQGTGLGLAISRSIITAMKSKIELESHLGVGSAFSFVLKLPLDKNGGEGAYEKDIAAKYDFVGKRLLVVDDVDTNIEITSFILENSGFIVETASNGQEALEKFFAAEIGHYDAILMDIQMPVMDGISATKEIRNSAREDSHSIPILALTANAFDEDLKKSITSGMDGHVNKPIQEEELFAILKKFV